MTYTHTYAILEVSESTFADVLKRLTANNYYHAAKTHDGRDAIDMHGIALAVEETQEAPTAETSGPCTRCNGAGVVDYVIVTMHGAQHRVATKQDQPCPSCTDVFAGEGADRG